MQHVKMWKTCYRVEKLECGLRYNTFSSNSEKRFVFDKRKCSHKVCWQIRCRQLYLNSTNSHTECGSKVYELEFWPRLYATNWSDGNIAVNQKAAGFFDINCPVVELCSISPIFFLSFIYLFFQYYTWWTTIELDGCFPPTEQSPSHKDSSPW